MESRSSKSGSAERDGGIASRRPAASTMRNSSMGNRAKSSTPRIPVRSARASSLGLSAWPSRETAFPAQQFEQGVSATKAKNGCRYTDMGNRLYVLLITFSYSEAALKQAISGMLFF